MNSYKVVMLLLILIITIKSNIQAGAWTQNIGGYYFKFETSYLKTTKEFNHNGKKLDILEEQFIYKNASFRDISLRFYGEYGLFENLTVIGKIPFKIYTTQYFLNDLYSQGEVSRNTAGLGDLRVLLKYGLLNQPFALSVQGGTKIPMGYDKHPENDVPRLGTGEIDFEGMLLAGVSLHPFPLYISGGVGLNKRSSPLHDEIVYHLESGYSLEKWFFKLYFNGIKNTETPPDLYGGEIQLPLPGGGGVTPDYMFGDIDLNQISFTISRELQEGMSIEATLFHILSGKNTISGQTFSMGLAIYK